MINTKNSGATDMLKIGDKVEVIKEHCNAKVGMQGIIAELPELPDKDSQIYGIRFDMPFNGGHDLNKSCEDGFGQYLPISSFKKITNNGKIKPSKPVIKYLVVKTSCNNIIGLKTKEELKTMQIDSEHTVYEIKPIFKLVRENKLVKVKA